jgi:hypothetical protein
MAILPKTNGIKIETKSTCGGFAPIGTIKFGKLKSAKRIAFIFPVLFQSYIFSY